MSFPRALLLPLFFSGLVRSMAIDSNTSCSPVLTQPYYPPSANCWEYKVPVTITTETNIFNFPDWKDDYALQDFLTAITTREAKRTPFPIVGMQNETASYTLAASFCTPKTPGKKTIILATHGIGKARQHWNSAYEPEQYNFVQHAISQGYSVWFYDRLGVGSPKSMISLPNKYFNLHNS